MCLNVRQRCSAFNLADISFFSPLSQPSALVKCCLRDPDHLHRISFLASARVSYPFLTMFAAGTLPLAFSKPGNCLQNGEEPPLPGASLPGQG